MEEKIKRYKVSFGEGIFEEMDPKLIAQARKNISEAMKPVVREYKRKQIISEMEASKLIINR